MKINNEVEIAVREAFAACVASESERLETALQQIADHGDTFANQAVTLAASVDLYALVSLHGGQSPRSEQVEHVAKTFTDSEAWAGMERADAEEFFAALSENRPAAIGSGAVVELAFLVGGYLLSAFLPDGREWTDFLDEILVALEAAPTS